MYTLRIFAACKWKQPASVGSDARRMSYTRATDDASGRARMPMPFERLQVRSRGTGMGFALTSFALPLLCEIRALLVSISSITESVSLSECVLTSVSLSERVWVASSPSPSRTERLIRSLRFRKNTRSACTPHWWPYEWVKSAISWKSARRNGCSCLSRLVQ